MDDNEYHVDTSTLPPAVAQMYMRGETLRLYQIEMALQELQAKQNKKSKKPSANKHIHSNDRITKPTTVSSSIITNSKNGKQFNLNFQYPNSNTNPEKTPTTISIILSLEEKVFKIMNFIKKSSGLTTANRIMVGTGIKLTNEILTKLVSNGNLMLGKHKIYGLVIQLVTNGLLIKNKKSLTGYLNSKEPYPLKLKDLQYDWNDGDLISFILSLHEKGSIVFDGENVVPVTDEILAKYLKIANETL